MTDEPIRPRRGSRFASDSDDAVAQSGSRWQHKGSPARRMSFDDAGAVSTPVSTLALSRASTPASAARSANSRTPPLALRNSPAAPTSATLTTASPTPPPSLTSPDAPSSDAPSAPRNQGHCDQRPTKYRTSHGAIAVFVGLILLLLAVLIPFTLNQTTNIPSDKSIIDQNLPASFANHVRSSREPPEYHHNDDGTTTTSAIYNLDGAPALVALLSYPAGDSVEFATHFGMTSTDISEGMTCGALTDSDQRACFAIRNQTAITVVSMRNQNAAELRYLLHELILRFA